MENDDPYPFWGKVLFNNHYLDLNAHLDGTDYGWLNDYGTCDVYINGKLEADDVQDYNTAWPAGTTYEIKDIKATGNHKFLGCWQGALTGTMGSSDIDLRLAFESVGSNIGRTYSGAATTYDELGIRLRELQNKLVGGYWTTDGSSSSVYTKSKYYYGYRGLGFSKYILDECFGIGDIGNYSEGRMYQIKASKATEYNRIWNLGESDSAAVQNLFKDTKIGDLVTFSRRGFIKYHSAIVVDVQDTGMVWFDCDSWGNNEIRSYFQSWETIASENTHITLFRANNYPTDMIYLDVNGKLDGVNSNDLGVYGTCDIKIGTDIVAENVTDYYTAWKYYTDYEITNIKANDGYRYVGVAEGELTGKLRTNTSVRLEFEKLTYAVTYNANGGTGAPATQTKYKDTALTLSSQIPKREGYTFLAWGLSANTTTYAYTPGSVYSENANLTLYAIWGKDGQEMATGAGQSILDGDYAIFSSMDTQYMLDIYGEDATAPENQNVAIWKVGGQGVQACDVFTITYLNNGFYSIKQKGTNMALSVAGASKAYRGNVRMNAYTGSVGQQWSITRAYTGDVYKGMRLVARCSGFSLDIQGSMENGSNVHQWPEHTAGNQSWIFVPYKPESVLADGRYILLTNLDTNYELDIPGETGDIPDGKNVQIWSNAAQSQFNAFDVISIGDGYYKLIHHASGKALTVLDDSTVFNKNVVVSAYTGATGQQWAILRDESAYVLLARCSGYALEVQDAEVADAVNVDQYRYISTKNKQWLFVPAEYTVRYEANGGTGAPAAQVKHYKGSLTLADSIPTLAGSAFEGWSVDPSATAAEYQPGDAYQTDSDTTLYAVWSSPDFVLPAALAEVGEEAFAGAAFKHAVVPEGVSNIRARAFANCPNLKYIRIVGSETVIDKDAFEGVEGLTIYGKDGSYAQFFAGKYGYTFKVE